MTTSTAPATERAERASIRRTLTGTGLGNALEWFDWQVYATFAPFIAAQLFDGTDPLSALLATLAVFAVGFVARPFGGLLFGWIADRRGRKSSLVLAIALASAGSLLIAVIPPFATVGAFASLLLLVARLVQGLAHGGEMPSAQTYLSEAAPRERRGLWSSFIYFSGTSGILCATLIGALLTTVLAPDFMAVWGWRIPFLLAAVLGLYALVMRSRLEETESYREVAKGPRERIWPQIVANRASALKVIGLTLGFTVAFYVWAVTAPTYASTSLGMDKAQALWAGVVGTVVFIVALPFWGALSDRIGRRPVLLIGSIGSAVLFFPMIGMMNDQPWTLIVAMSVMLVFLSACASIAPAVYAELFPTGIRTVGTAVPYAISVALFGGTAPYLQTWLTSIGSAWMFTAYAVLLLLISAAVVAFSLTESKGKDLTSPVD